MENNQSPWFPWSKFFTSETVYALLRDKVLKGSDVLPTPTDPAIANIAELLNILRWKCQLCTGPLPREIEEVKEIRKAIWLLAEMLPKHRRSLAAELEGANRWANSPTLTPFKDDLARVRTHLTATDALIAAAEAAMEHGLPYMPLMSLASSVEMWEDFAEELQKQFINAFPDRSKAASYRFIEAITPDITGENPTFLAIESAFKKGRLVNRGNRFA